jgi:hypothetical protein
MKIVTTKRDWKRDVQSEKQMCDSFCKHILFLNWLHILIITGDHFHLSFENFGLRYQGFSSDTGLCILVISDCIDAIANSSTSILF